MTSKGVVDIVFCLDASASMQPCIDAVRSNITEFIAGLQSNQQIRWDWRLDFVAHCAGEDQRNGYFFARSLYHPGDLIEALYSKDGPNTGPNALAASQTERTGLFFTNNLEEFRQGLSAVGVKGDEAPLIALDCALDFPWRRAEGCHRVVILMADEPFETGAYMDHQRSKLQELIHKVMRLKVMLFIVAPESAVFDQLAAADRSEYEVVNANNDGLRHVDFRQVLGYVGRSVSVSNPQAAKPEPVQRGLYSQPSWGVTQENSLSGR